MLQASLVLSTDPSGRQAPRALNSPAFLMSVIKQPLSIKPWRKTRHSPMTMPGRCALSSGTMSSASFFQGLDTHAFRWDHGNVFRSERQLAELVTLICFVHRQMQRSIGRP